MWHKTVAEMGRADLPYLLFEADELLGGHGGRLGLRLGPGQPVQVRVHELAVEHEQHVQRGEVRRVRAQRRQPRVV